MGGVLQCNFALQCTLRMRSLINESPINDHLLTRCHIASLAIVVT